jgi:Protein of unknown function (DUF2934)
MKPQQAASGTPRKGSTRKPPRAARVGRDEMIRQTAYSYYEARGSIDGHDLEDWLKAEAQVSQAFAADSEPGQAPSH